MRRECLGTCRLEGRRYVIQNQLGLRQPVHGYLWKTEAWISDCQLPARRFANMAIEGEIALRLERNVPTTLLADLDNVADFVECWFPVIELHNHVFRGRKPTSQELVAGNAIQAGFISPVGPGERDLASLDRAEIRIEIDGGLVEHKSVVSLPNGPLGSLRWLVSALTRHGLNLKKGDVVLTGSPGRLIPIKAGSSVVVRSARQQVHFFCAEERAAEPGG